MECPLPPAARLHPRRLAETAVERLGRAVVVRWCEEVLAGNAGPGDDGDPPWGWIGGSAEWDEYWHRTWAARTLLHIGPPDRPGVVLAALDDPHWRVREMALKVIRAHGLDDPGGKVEDLLGDENHRVRAAAARVLETEFGAGS
ncbi:HEAT repeat domain-containing protein [Promicromonospora sp. NPDC057138]|uniref:HEAT repeat domain-containing protein n=1 Tax=Promicromonospora sp. NPDC057138 TaxID=3346031 RepID=UPI0036324359